MIPGRSSLVNIPLPEYLTVKEVAGVFMLQERSITRLIRLGKVPAIKVGLRHYIPKNFVFVGENGSERSLMNGDENAEA